MLCLHQLTGRLHCRSNRHVLITIPCKSSTESGYWSLALYVRINRVVNRRGGRRSQLKITGACWCPHAIMPFGRRLHAAVKHRKPREASWEAQLIGITEGFKCVLPVLHPDQLLATCTQHTTAGTHTSHYDSILVQIRVLLNLPHCTLCSEQQNMHMLAPLRTRTMALRHTS